MNAYVMIEGTRVYPDAEPIDTDQEKIHAKKAIRGSKRLRDAILKAQGLPIPRPSRRKTEACPSCQAPVAPRRYLVTDIQKTVGAYYGFHERHMKSDDRRRELARARQVAMFLATELTPHSIAEVGRRFNRDHTTVLYAVKAVNERAESDYELAHDIALLRERLSA